MVLVAKQRERQLEQKDQAYDSSDRVSITLDHYGKTVCHCDEPFHGLWKG